MNLLEKKSTFKNYLEPFKIREWNSIALFATCCACKFGSNNY